MQANNNIKENFANTNVSTIYSTSEYYKTENDRLHNGWLNKQIYRDDAVEYSIKFTDNNKIKKYRWKTNASGLKTINDSIDNSNSNNEFAYGSSSDGTYTFSELKDTQTIKVYFKADGIRYGFLEVWDEAGNRSTMHIRANIDREAPPSPNVVLQTVSNSSYTSKQWINMPVNSYVSISEEEQAILDADISGIPNNRYYQYNSDAATYVNSTQTYSKEGKHVFKYANYDNAGNYSSYVENEAWIDLTPPECSVAAYKNATTTKYTGGWLKKDEFVTLKGTCTDTNGTVNSGCEETDPVTKKIEDEYNGTYNWTKTVKDKAKNSIKCKWSNTVKIDQTPPDIKCSVKSDRTINDSETTDLNGNGTTTNPDVSGIKTKKYIISDSTTTPAASSSSWGNNVAGPNTCGNKTYYGYMKVTDNAGNEAIKKCSSSYTTGPCCSEENPFGCDWKTSCRDGKTKIWDTSKGESGSIQAGEVRHGNSGGTEDKLYLFKENGSYVTQNGLTKVCAATGIFYSPSLNGTAAPTITIGTQSCKVVWIYSNCVAGSVNSICSYSQCPG